MTEYRLVPVEPTEEMIRAMQASNGWVSGYRAALAAAPVVEAKPVEWPDGLHARSWAKILRDIAHESCYPVERATVRNMAAWIESHPVLYEHPPEPVTPDDVLDALSGIHTDAAHLIERLAAERDEARAALANVNFRPTIEGEAAAIIERLREERDEARKEVERQMQLRASVEAEHAQMLGEVERLRKLADERGALLTVALRP